MTNKGFISNNSTQLISKILIIILSSKNLHEIFSLFIRKTEKRNNGAKKNKGENFIIVVPQNWTTIGQRVLSEGRSEGRRPWRCRHSCSWT